MKFHFWYSYQQKIIQDDRLEKSKGIIKNNYATVNGREVLFTKKTKDKKHDSKFDDITYLGYGIFSRVEEDRGYNRKIVPKLPSKNSNIPVNVKVSKTRTGYKIAFEMLDIKVKKLCDTKQRVLFEKSRIARLKRLVECCPGHAKTLILEYQNN